MTAKFVQHRSPQTNKAKAPYNFVPLPEKVLTVEGDEKEKIEKGLHDRYYSDRHTGYIDLEITTETPLYTRCAFPPSVYGNQNNFDETGKLKVTAVRDCQDFFHRGDEKKIPVIPGSTLRGMTRSLVEILAYGKMNFVTDAAIIHRAVADSNSLGKKYREQMLGKNKDYPRIWFDYPSPNLRGGYLEVINDKWFIRPAIEHENESFIHVSYESAKTAFGGNLERHKASGYDCWVVPRKRQTKEKSDKFKLDMATTGQVSFAQTEDEAKGWRKAKLIVSGSLKDREGNDVKKMECAIYERDEKAELIEIEREDRLLYLEDMRLSREKKNTPRKLKDGEPLFYLLNEKKELVFFGSTMMFRLPYTNTVHDLIPELLRSQEQVDLAEAIFGTVESPNKKKRVEGRQLAGRVFFSDAVCQKSDDVFYQNDKHGRIVPKILLSPKPTSFQLYLAQPEPNHYEPRDAQNGQGDLKAKWYVVTEKALEKMEMDDVPKNVIDKVRKLLGREFVIDNSSKADEKFIRALESSGVTRDELRKYRKNILNSSAHELRTYYDDYESEYGTVIRGAKRYWHRKEVLFDSSDKEFVADDKFVIVEKKGVFDKSKKDKNGKWQESKQHTIIKPVKDGVQFEKGRVYFENLSGVELGALLTALDLPSNMRHQIGMAKPYGLGTVKIEIKNFVLQDRAIRYQSLLDEQNSCWNNDSQTSAERETEKQKAISVFQSAVLENYNGLVTPNCKASDFWQIPRLQTLAAMLEWQNAGSFEDKQYQDLTSPQWRNRHVLPYPQTVESQQNEPKQIQLINPNLWTKECVEPLTENLCETKTEQKQQVTVSSKPTVSMSLLNLPEKDVPAQIRQYYDAWLTIQDAALKLETAKAIIQKCKSWKKAKEKDWYKEVVEYIVKNQ
jgi:CRISPR-associated protein (TIGR03986 family)